ncbi:MAG TPA: hypothetical protein VN837_11380, partial [Chloroflexota bacterium]|nr:hypothetical protein [Chloroflexota bacterium]
HQRAGIVLAVCALFAVALLASMLWPSPPTQAAPPCQEGAVIGQALSVPDSSGGTHLFAITRPPIAPNLAQGNEPGCEALWRSDDAGITWTTVFSNGAEAPQTITADQAGGLYLLTQRLQFPLYLAGNLYRDASPGIDGQWNRISPQGRHDVPNVAISTLLVGRDGTLTALAENGNGGALLRSDDGGATWRSVIIPHLLTVGSAALLDPMLAVAPPLYTLGQPPGLASDDGGGHWRPLGLLPNAPMAPGLQAILTGNPISRALLLDLVNPAAVTPDSPVARYVSLDGGYHWSPVVCGTRPAPGCAPPAQWAQTTRARYVLYQNHIWTAPLGHAWRRLPMSLPAAADTVVQVLAIPLSQSDQIYLVTLTGIWRLDGARWTSVSSGLALGPPASES